MNRRDFLKNSTIAALAAGTSVVYGNVLKYSGFTSRTNSTGYDLVSAKGGEPDEMFDKAIESLGGMKNFVKEGQKVVIKPNICFNAPPERASNTNPVLVKRIVEHCFDAGAGEVIVFDHTGDNWKDAYKNSGIEKAASDTGAKLLPGNDENDYREVSIKEAKSLKNVQVHKYILESDVFINVPVLKHHGGMQISGAMKNLMGVVWDRTYWHKNDLPQCIADFALFCKPHLNVIDAYNVITRNGPRGISVNDVVNMKSLIISRDIVAADSVASRLLGLEPDKLNFIKIANTLGLGEMNISKLSINNINL